MTETETFGPYRLLGRLGAGGMGEVWKAVDERLGRPVALKLLAPDLQADPEARRRFVRESRASSALNHPNIVTVYEAGDAEGRLYQAQELVVGRTVADLVREGPVPVSLLADIARQALRGLEAAHGAGIVHRDVKPENLMVREDGLVKLLDFGLARLPAADRSVDLTAHDAILGTPRYMAPEQAVSGKADARSDLFSLGAVLYEMLCGRPAFPGATLGEVFSRLLECRPAPLEGLDPRMAGLVVRLLQKEPDRRPAGAREVLAALEDPGPPPPREALAERRLVVLPVAASPEDEPLADGLTGELIARVGEIRGLAVLGRSTSLRYRGRSDAREVGRELGAGLVLEGSLRRSGSHLRVAAGLVDARDGFQLWSGRFDGTVGEVFAMEDRIAAAVVEALQGRLEGLALAPAAPRREVSSRARELYLEGSRHLSSLDASRGRRVLGALQEAVQLEPGFGQARARLALALMQAATLEAPEQARSLFERAGSEAVQALALAPESSEARLAVALVALVGEDWAEARRLLRRLLQDDPESVEALCWLSYVCTTLGNCEEGALLARRAARLDPEGATALHWLCYALASQGRLLDASEAAARALRLDPANPYGQLLVLLTDVALGRLDDAARYAEHLEALPERDAFCQVGLMLLRAAREPAGPAPEGVEGLRRDLDCERLLASVFALLDRPLEALDLLRGAVTRGYRNLAWLDNDPTLDRLRDHPAFPELRNHLAAALREDPELDGALTTSGRPSAPRPR